MEPYVSESKASQPDRPRKIRMGILGGSFDPVHFGHIKPCLQMAQDFDLASIRLLPCKVSPFKTSPHSTPKASVQHRLMMLSLVASANNLIQVDERELRRETPSYTYLSLREMVDEFGDQVTLCWIMGMDALNGFPDWFKSDEIMELCHILVMPRPGYELDLSAQPNVWIEKYLSDDIELLEQKSAGHLFITSAQMLDISSTQIRDTIASGKQPRYLVPGGIWNYIQRNHLYGASE